MCRVVKTSARSLAPVFAPLIALTLTGLEARADTLKIGTLVPAESPWGKVFKVWGRAVSERTGGSITLQFYWNGQQGEEDAMVGKMRTGQLDGAAVSAIGLGQIYKQVNVFQLPGLFSSWAKLDAARAALRPQMDTEVDKQGFKILGWGDVGTGRVMSNGYVVRTPSDLKHKGTFIIPGDPIDPVIYATIGDITPQSMAVPEILPGLTSGGVTFLNVPSLIAEQLQWAPRLDRINTYATHYEIGALVMTSAKLKALPADAQAVITETGKIAADALTESIRKEDDAAFARRKSKMTAYDPSPSEQEEWAKLFASVRGKLRGTAFQAAIVDEATKYSK